MDIQLFLSCAATVTCTITRKIAAVNIRLTSNLVTQASTSFSACRRVEVGPPSVCAANFAEVFANNMGRRRITEVIFCHGNGGHEKECTRQEELHLAL